jgi:nucleotide-binding universal stress UspA family protein
MVEANGKETTMKPILLATDGSASAEAALTQAIELSLLTESPLTVVSVMHPQAPAYGAGYGYSSGELFIELEKAERERVDTVLAEAVAAAERAGVGAQAILADGNPVEEICRVASELEPRLLVVGAHGFGLVQRIVHGSVSTGLLHHAPCPILVVPGPMPVAKHVEKEKEAAVA